MDEKHLPECWLSEGKFDALCICDRLRACEQRVLDAAQEAVQKWISYTFPGYRPGWTQQISSTIDALCR